MVCGFWRKLTHNISIWSASFPSKERNLEVDVLDGPAIGRRILTEQAQAWSAGSWTIRLLSMLLAILAFLEIAIAMPLDC